MVIFHSYVKLPEGTQNIKSLWSELLLVSTSMIDHDVRHTPYALGAKRRAETRQTKENQGDAPRP